MPNEKKWYVYMLECSDGSLYTGSTVDVERRYAEHQSGDGAKYTRMKGVRNLVYREACGTRSDALKRELEIKALSRGEKEKLISVL